ncbi:MAG: PPC domain-containing protein [Planctomycetes bacterium]|nr:PPC domain-containing protein [Planctomycetota bacterium]
MLHPLRHGLVLFLSVGAMAQSIVAEGAEPNGYPNYTTIQCGQQGDGVIASVADTDYWRIQCSGAMTLRAFVGPGFAQPRIQDTVLELRDAGNTLLASNDDGSGIGLYSEVRDFRVPGPGAYFLVVRGYAAYTGSYSLDVQCGPSGPAWAPGGECGEPNITNGTACPATCWNRLAGAIASAGDKDRFVFTATSGQRITFSTGPGVTGVAISDTTLTLRSDTGTVIADNDDALGLYSRISYSFTSSGTYYIDVAGYLDQVVGTYQLELDCSGVVPSPGSMTTFGAGCIGSLGHIPRIQRRTSSSGLTYVERPIIGTVMVGDMTQCPPGGLLVIGGAFQELNPSINLGILGAPGCMAQIIAVSLEAQVVGGSGTAQWTLNVPYDQNLVGAAIEYQGIVLDQFANSLGLIVSNRLRAIVGNSF